MEAARSSDKLVSYHITAVNDYARGDMKEFEGKGKVPVPFLN